MRLTDLVVKAFRGIETDFTLPLDSSTKHPTGKNLLVFGENGSAKTSLARALEIFFETRPGRDLASQQNLFTTAAPSIELTFVGQIGGAFHTETHTWTGANPRPVKDWLKASSARSAFLDHRKLLLLSDQTRSLDESFFLAAAKHLFAHLPVAATGNTVGALWEEILADRKSYVDALAGKGRAAATGISDPVAHRKVVETKVNALNLALDDYLLAPAGKKPRLVEEAGRFLGLLEGKTRQLDLALSFEHLVFDHTDGSLSGGRLNPTVTFCAKALTKPKGADSEATHHEVLNEARLTAIALALFFAAVKLQDAIAYIPTAGEPDAPARLLVLDDVLIGLDYDHRMPVLQIVREEFVKAGFQVVLMTHNRMWFDLCRMEVEDDKTWLLAELYTKRGRGTDKSDVPVRKKVATDLLKRAKDFLKQNEWQAAANYARTSIEASLRTICDRRRIPVVYRIEAERHDTEEFLNALKEVKRAKGGTTLLIPQKLQSTLKSLRKTVLNPLTHGASTTVGRTEVDCAIKAAEKLARIAARRK